MRTAQAEIVIDAQLQRVWDVMLDLKRYPEWNPFTVQIDCPEGMRAGAPIDLHVRWGDGSGLVSHEQVNHIQPPAAGNDGAQRASYAYNFGGPLAALNLVRSHRVQEIRELPGGKTHYRTHIRLTGLLSGFAPLSKVQDGFDRQTAALKARCESRL